MSHTRVMVKLNKPNIKATEIHLQAANELTADAVLSDIISKQVMPFDYGTMQNDQTFVDRSNMPTSMRITTSAPQAERLYFHPEYDFQTVNNSFARAGWFEPWISGPRADWVKGLFARIAKRLAGETK